MDNNNLVTALLAQIQTSIGLIGMVKKLATDKILAKRWSFTPEKTITATMQREIRTKLHPLFLRRVRMNDRNVCYHCLADFVFSDMMFASKVIKKVNRCAQAYATDFG